MDSLPFKVELPTCSDTEGTIPSAPSQNNLALAILQRLQRGREDYYRQLCRPALSVGV